MARIALLLAVLVITFSGCRFVFCADARVMMDGATYYKDYSNCLANDYPGKAALLTTLGKYVGRPCRMKAFQWEVCGVFPPDEQPYCNSGAFSLPSEMNAFHNILTSTADRETLCLMAEETASEVEWYMETYINAKCGTL